LALGNVERFLAQTRMIARKILHTHMRESEEHTIDEIIEDMASKLYFHGHPINRKEAKDELRLKVNLDLSPALESGMWDLFKDYEEEFENLSIFHPPGDLAAMAPQPTGAPTQLPLPGNPQAQQMFMLAQAAQAAPVEKQYELVHAYVETTRLSSKFTTSRRFRLFAGNPVQPMIQEDILTQGWSHSSAPAQVPESQPHSSSPEGAPAGGDVPQGMTEQQSQSD